jgi:acyl carrier protein
MSDARAWLVEYFEANGDVRGRSVEELAAENYVSMELLDSLGIVQMLVGLEEEFGVWLDPAEMQDPRFCSLDGLAELVEESRARA